MGIVFDVGVGWDACAVHSVEQGICILLGVGWEHRCGSVRCV
jgi:hypothetical protein